MPFVYHPDLETRPGYNPVEVPDDPGLIAVLGDSGWGLVEDPEQTDPALAPAADQSGAVYVAVTPDPDDAPPRAGKGSGRDEWVTYAESLGVEVTDDMTRDDIADAVEGTDK